MSRNSNQKFRISTRKLNILPGTELGDGVLSDLNKAWESVDELKLKLQRTEDQLQAVGRHDFKCGISTQRVASARFLHKVHVELPDRDPPVRKVRRLGKSEDLTCQNQDFEGTANNWQQIEPLFEPRVDKDLSLECQERTQVRVLNDHFEIFAAKLREDLLRNVGIEKFSRPPQPDPLHLQRHIPKQANKEEDKKIAVLPPHQEMKQKVRPAMVTKTKMAPFAWETMNFSSPPKPDGKPQKVGTDADPSSGVHFDTNDTDKKPLTVKKVVCSSAKFEESAITPSSWRRGQLLILKELGPDPTKKPAKRNNHTQEKAEHPQVTSETAVKKPVSDVGGNAGKEIKSLPKKKSRNLKGPEPLKKSSPKTRHYDAEAVRKYMKQRRIETKKRKDEDNEKKREEGDKKKKQLEKLVEKQKEMVKSNLTEKRKNVHNVYPPPVLLSAQDPLDWIPATFSHLRQQESLNGAEEKRDEAPSSPSSGPLDISPDVEKPQNGFREMESPTLRPLSVFEANTQVTTALSEDTRRSKLRDIGLQALRIQQQIDIETRKLSTRINSSNYRNDVPQTIPKFLDRPDIPPTKTPDFQIPTLEKSTNTDLNKFNFNLPNNQISTGPSNPKIDPFVSTHRKADPTNFINTFIRKLTSASGIAAISTVREPEEIPVLAGDDRRTESSPSQHAVSLSETETEDDQSRLVVDDLSEGPLTDGDTDTEVSLPKDTVEESVAEREDQLGEPLKMSPSKLRLRMTTELTYLETLQESLGHLAQMEHLRALAVSQQETATLARALRGRSEQPDEPSLSEGSVSSASLEEGPVEELEVSVEVSKDEGEVSYEVQKDVPEELSGVSEGRISEGSFRDEKSEAFRMILPSESHRRKSFGNSSDIDRPLSSSSPDVMSKTTRPFSGKDSFQEFTLAMVRQFMEEEEMRDKHQRALLKLREQAVEERAKAQIWWLHLQKKRLQDKGADDKLPPLRRREKIVLCRLRKEQLEIGSLREAQRVARNQRQVLLKQQHKVSRLRLSTEQMWDRLRKMAQEKGKPNGGRGDVSSSTPTIATDIEDRTTGESDHIPEESFSVGHSSRTASVLSAKEKSSGDEGEITPSDHREEISSLESPLVLRKLETSKRHLTKREQRLNRRRQYVEELLEWHRRYREEVQRVKDMEKRALDLLAADKRTNRNAAYSEGPLSPSTTENKEISVADVSPSISEHVVSDAATSVGEDLPDVITENNEMSSKDMTETSGKRQVLPLRLPLTPLKRRTDSSGSEGSPPVSHSETVSDMSDVEGRIRALKEDLRRRKLEVERLKRERHRRNRERLKAQEESLVKQIEAYDSFIERAKLDLKAELEKDNTVSQVKPQIKKPEPRRIKATDAGEGDHLENISPLPSPVSEVSRWTEDPQIALSAEEVVSTDADPVGEEDSSNLLEDVVEGNFLSKPEDVQRTVDKILMGLLYEDIKVIGQYFKVLSATVITLEQKETVEDEDGRRVWCEDVAKELMLSGVEEAFRDVRKLFVVPGGQMPEDPSRSETSVSQRVHEILAKFADTSPPKRFLQTTPQDLLVLSPWVEDVAQGPRDDPEGFRPEASDEKFFTDPEWFEDDLVLEEEPSTDKPPGPPLNTDNNNYQIYQYQDSFYIREIPNKPPPPYSLPAIGSEDPVPSADPESVKVEKATVGSVVECEEEIRNRVREYAEKHLGQQLGTKDREEEVEEPEGSQFKDVFYVFLDHLTEDLVKNLKFSGRKLSRQASDEELKEMVASKAMGLLRLGPGKRKKTGLVGKKRDFVDEILIEELRKEEVNWITYEEDELAVKLQITDSIYKDLLEDAVRNLKVTLVK